MSEPQSKLAVVGEKEQAFGLRIEPADVEETGKFCRQKIENSVASIQVFSCRNETGGFMQHDGERWVGMEHFAIHFHVVARSWLRAEICADQAIDGDATCCDEFIAMTPRTDPGEGEKTIQAHAASLKR